MTTIRGRERESAAVSAFVAGDGVLRTLVLSGSFVDGTDLFVRGDIEDADASVTHQPTATLAEDCICLAVTDAPLRFSTGTPFQLSPPGVPGCAIVCTRHSMAPVSASKPTICGPPSAALAGWPQVGQIGGTLMGSRAP